MTELVLRRHDEYARMQRYARGEECLMAFVAAELDDPAAEPCGRCAVCVGAPLLDETVDPALVEAAAGFKETTKRKTTRRRRPPKTTARVKRRRRRPKQ